MCAFSFRVRSELTNHSLILGMGKWKKKQIFSTVSFSKLIWHLELGKAALPDTMLMHQHRGPFKERPREADFV